MQQTRFDFDEILTHDETHDCVSCRAFGMTMGALRPAVEAWEVANNLPQFALVLHGSAGLLAMMLEDGVPREDIENALSQLLDEYEQMIAEDGALHGPAHGNA